MGAGGQWAAGEGVVDGAHGFRVVKISSGLWFQMCTFFGDVGVKILMHYSLPKTLVLFLHTRRVPEAT